MRSAAMPSSPSLHVSPRALSAQLRPCRPSSFRPCLPCTPALFLFRRNATAQTCRAASKQIRALRDRDAQCSEVDKRAAKQSQPIVPLVTSCQGPLPRRALLAYPLSAAPLLGLLPFLTPFLAHADVAEQNQGGPSSSFTDMPALRGKDYGKTKMKYPDYTETQTGLQYKDLKEGAGPTPRPGDTVVIDWDGFTIGYYGRIFEARNKAKGGSFEGGEKDLFRFRVGSNEVIPAFEEAIQSMQLGGIRRIIVPPELGYPNNDFNQKGPRPITFSGQRALDFVLKNQGLIDKTLLFDIELLRITPA